MGKALNSSPKANFRGQQSELRSMLWSWVVVESKEKDNCLRGSSFKTVKETRRGWGRRQRSQAM